MHPPPLAPEPAHSPAFSALLEAVRAEPPAVAFVLGSGMGGVSDRVAPTLRVPFVEVPGLPQTSVVGHQGRLTLGDWAGKRVLVCEGRLHYYEGHSWEIVTLPVRTAVVLGARAAVLTNAAGGIGDALSPGSLMAITDHMECNRPYWWRQPGPGGLGATRPSPCSAWCR